MFGFGFNILKRKGGINLILPAEEYIEEGSIVDVTEINAVNTWFKTICGDNTDQQALCDNPYSIDFLYKFRVLNLSSPTSLDACRINAANVGGVLGDFTDGGSLSHSPTGIDWGGDSYLNPHFTLDDDMFLHCGLTSYCRTNGIDHDIWGINASSTLSFWHSQRRTGDNMDSRVYSSTGGSGRAVFSNADSRGIMTTSRYLSNPFFTNGVLRVFRNGVEITNPSTPIDGGSYGSFPNAYELGIGTRLDASGNPSVISNGECNFYAVHLGLTRYEIEVLHRAVVTYNTNVIPGGRLFV